MATKLNTTSGVVFQTTPAPTARVNLTHKGIVASKGGASTSAIYSAAILADSPVAYWRMDASSGPSQLDSSGNNNTITLEPTGITYGVTGIVPDNTGFSFNGDQWDRPSTIANPISVSGSYSIEFWINLTNDVPVLGFDWVGAVIVDKTHTVGIYAIQDLPDPYGFSTGLGLVAFDHDVESVTCTTLEEGTLYHAVFVASGGAAHWYINGVDATLAADGTTFNTVTPVVLDAVFTDLAVEGLVCNLIDELAVYNVALTPTQIAAHYAAASSGTLMLGS
jgi:hypothetical protein